MFRLNTLHGYRMKYPQKLAQSESWKVNFKGSGGPVVSIPPTIFVLA